MKNIYDNYYITENGDIYNKYNKKLKPCNNGRGYLIVGLTLSSGKRIVKSVHRLLAEAFIDNPFNYSDVNHIDGDRLNNNLNNLEWLTHGDNIKHSYKLENRSAKGSNNSNCKTSESTVNEICDLLQQGFSSACIRDLGYNYNIVRKIKNRKIWLDISSNYIF